MASIRKKYPPSFKAKIALEAIREDRTSADLASQYQFGVHPRVRFADGTIWRRDELDITKELSEVKDILFNPEQLKEKRKE